MAMNDTPKQNPIDLLGLDGGQKIIRARGLDALEALLEAMGIQHKMLQSKFSVWADDRTSSTNPTDNAHTPRIDEAMLIPDDAARLEAKRAKLGVSPQAHRALTLTLDRETLEAVYNRAGALEPQKALPPAEREFFLMSAADRLLPPDVQAAASRVLGDKDYERVIVRLQELTFWGPGVKSE